MCSLQRTAEMQGGEFTALGKIWAFGLALALLLPLSSLLPVRRGWGLRIR